MTSPRESAQTSSQLTPEQYREIERKPEDILDPHSIGYKIKIADLYEDITLPS
jgi:hypothetical protein